MRSHDVFSKLDDKRQILTDGNLDIPTQTIIVFTLIYIVAKKNNDVKKRNRKKKKEGLRKKIELL